MKRIVLISFGTLMLLGLGMVYSVWRETQAPVTHTPGAVETGRAQLRAQLDQAKKTEGDTERQNWNSPDQLKGLIEELKDNKEAAEIVAYDRDAVDRLEKRISQIAEEEAARAEAEKEAAKQAAAEARQ